MADAVTLSGQVEAYHRRKKELIRNITRYRRWLEVNKLLSGDVDRHLQRSMRLLVEDELTIAFVGEYSRGKTELINALLFAGHGQRLLPSEAGRTTMCPTELFFDRHSRSNYLRLLPIESRTDREPAQQLRHRPEAWEALNLDPEDSVRTAATLARVAETRSVTPEYAEELGFSEQTLDRDSDAPDKVVVPAWRHAMISVQHPMLERGLRILDTPGLNALGSEPELTVSMLPSAQAVLFLLSADAGVTASDMTIWKKHIDTRDADHRAGRFAILNKIDVLWDDLKGASHTNAAIERVRQNTARQLELPAADVMPVSAKQGLLAHVRDDEALRRRSGLLELETLISERILTRKERLISGDLVADLARMLRDNRAALGAQQDALREEIEALDAHRTDRTLLAQLAERTRRDYDYYTRKLITLRSSRRLMESQGEMLKEIMNLERFDEHAETTREKLESSWTTPGLNSAMRGFFQVLENQYSNLMTEDSRAERMVGAIYRRYNEETRGHPLEPVPLRIGRHLIALRNLRSRADRFLRHPKTVLTEQQRLIEQFFRTIVSEARRITENMLQDIGRWPSEALMPVLQHTQQQKQRLETQFSRLREMTEDETQLRQQRRELQQALETTERQQRVARKLEERIVPSSSEVDGYGSGSL